MILSASLEFEKKYNSEIVERSSDEYEMPQVRSIDKLVLLLTCLICILLINVFFY